jgi:hypothetical protein
MNDNDTTCEETNHPIDAVVKTLEMKLLPEFENQVAILKKEFPEFIFETRSLRHADQLHTLGLRCHSNKTDSIRDAFSLHINVFDIKGISARGFVGWNSFYTDSKGTRRTHFESMTRSYKNLTKDNLDGLFHEIPKLYVGLKRALKKGHPPSRLERIWNRLTHRCD